MATQTSNYGVSEAPGTAFNYNDWQTALFADTLFQNVYQSSYSMVDQQVLNPLLVDILQMEDAPTLQPGPGRMQLSTRDFVRFGLLFLHRGTWNGTRVLSSTHATMAVTDPLPNTLPQSTGIPADMCPGQRTWGSADISGNQIDHEGSYSWLWWTNGINQSGQRLFPDAPPDTYGAFGHGGKRAIVVLPSLHLVVSWNDTHLSSWPKVNEALRRLVVAVTGHHHPATSPDGGRAATVLSDESTAIPPFTATSTSTATVLWMNPQPHLSQSDAPYKGGTPGIQMFHAAWCSRAVQNVPYHLLEDVDMSHNSFKATGTTRCPAWHRNNHVNRPRLNGRIQELNTS